jgi:hypothetical protein
MLPYKPYGIYGSLEASMSLVKKTIELDQEQLNRIKAALNVKSEKAAIHVCFETI